MAFPFGRRVLLEWIEGRKSFARSIDGSATLDPVTGFVVSWVEDPGVELVPPDANEPARRWILLDADGARTAGPAYNGENSIDTVRIAVSEWLRITA